jgi:hypothetical protein
MFFVKTPTQSSSLEVVTFLDFEAEGSAVLSPARGRSVHPLITAAEVGAALPFVIPRACDFIDFSREVIEF